MGISNKLFKSAIASALLLVGTASAYASTLNYTIHADDNFTVYLSDSDSTQGTQIGANTGNWQVGHTLATPYTLDYGKDYFIHIQSTNVASFAGVLGQFVLSAGTGHQFASSDPFKLLTNATDWLGNNTGFNGTYGSISNIATNGGGIWGPTYTSDVSSSAYWIWTGPTVGTTYLTAKITHVPEPGSIALLGFGLTALVTSRRRFFNRNKT